MALNLDEMKPQIPVKKPVSTKYSTIIYISKMVDGEDGPKMVSTIRGRSSVEITLGKRDGANTTMEMAEVDSQQMNNQETEQENAEQTQSYGLEKAEEDCEGEETLCKIIVGTGETSVEATQNKNDMTGMENVSEALVSEENICEERIQETVIDIEEDNREVRDENGNLVEVGRRINVSDELSGQNRSGVGERREEREGERITLRRNREEHMTDSDTTTTVEYEIGSPVKEHIKKGTMLSYSSFLNLFGAIVIAICALATDSTLALLPSMLFCPVIFPLLAFFVGARLKLWKVLRNAVFSFLKFICVCVLLGYVAGSVLSFIVKVEPDWMPSSQWPTQLMKSGGLVPSYFVTGLLAVMSGLFVAVMSLGKEMGPLMIAGLEITLGVLPYLVSCGMLFGVAVFKAIEAAANKTLPPLPVSANSTEVFANVTQAVFTNTTEAVSISGIDLDYTAADLIDLGLDNLKRAGITLGSLVASTTVFLLCKHFCKKIGSNYHRCSIHATAPHRNTADQCSVSVEDGQTDSEDTDTSCLEDWCRAFNDRLDDGRCDEERVSKNRTE